MGAAESRGGRAGGQPAGRARGGFGRRDLAVASSGRQPGGGGVGQPQGAGTVRPGHGGRPRLHHRRQRGRDPQGEGPGKSAEEAAGTIATFYERLRTSLEGETDRASRAALAEALFDAAGLYGEVDAPEKALEAHRKALELRVASTGSNPRIKPHSVTLAAVTLLWRESSYPGISSMRRMPSWAVRVACSGR